ncbi:hypothetical protein CAEBREN_32664 [Caenorhabditis brenneri]|uniref:Serpentine receptor class r-10 n=1 Tax=Caenorhabditis brenneri TaxID=135651 RepID=G0MUM3_CAEBE|nr:hypothetical protein CAEBREN_32664 [Caenorhabditis brenneri]
MHIYGACVLIYSDSFLKSEKSIAFILVGMYCATFGLCILLLATHFVYRYFAICRNSINETYQEDILEVGYIALLYYQSCIWTMVICGWKTYQKMKSVGGTMSKITKELNSQLFKTLVLQVMHIYGSCMIVYADSFLKFKKELAFQLVAAYCSTFALCVLLLTTHFVYRYIAVCREIILELYDEDTHKVGFMAMMYHYIDETGKFIICWGDFLSAFLTCGVMEVCIGTMAFCGWKTYWTLRRARDSMSAKTKELNNQLFKTLIIQTLVPICTLFTPVGSLIILPMFSIGVGKLANAPSFYAGFYPAVDALIIIFMIRDFRETVLCKRSQRMLSEMESEITGRAKKPVALNSVGPTAQTGSDF